MNKWIKIILLVIGIAILGYVIAMLFSQPKDAGAVSCGTRTVGEWCNTQNVENKGCICGLTCKHESWMQPHDGKCVVTPTATPTATPTVKPTCTPTATPTVKPTETPKPPKDYCKNFEKDQKEVPYGMVSIEGICSCAKGYHQVDEELLRGKKEYDTFTCELDEPTPEPTVKPSSEPRSESVLVNNTTEAPSCGSTAPVLAALNFHVYRNGDTAICKWVPTNGNTAHIYYKNPKSTTWEHAVRDIPNNGYFVINGLGNNDWTFALQQNNDCAGGLMSQYVVDGGTSKWILFR